MDTNKLEQNTYSIAIDGVQIYQTCTSWLDFTGGKDEKVICCDHLLNSIWLKVSAIINTEPANRVI